MELAYTLDLKKGVKMVNSIYGDCKVYGAYTRKDGRQHMVLVFHNEKGEIIKKKTISYPKFLVECYLNRFLQDNETVDHIDGDFLNNSLGNLQVIDRSKHVKLDAKRIKEKVFKCSYCGLDYIPKNMSNYYSNKRRGNRGSFCSKSCVGKASSCMDKLFFEVHKKEHYTLKSLQVETFEVEEANSANLLTIGTPSKDD